MLGSSPLDQTRQFLPALICAVVDTRSSIADRARFVQQVFTYFD
jgi:hypothetical protein